MKTLESLHSLSVYCSTDPAQSTVPSHLRNVSCILNAVPTNGPQHVLRCDYKRDDTTTDHSDDLAVRCGKDWYGGKILRVQKKYQGMLHTIFL